MKKREVHRVFGVRENAVYTDREGACLIPVRGSLVGVIRTPKGYFHPVQTYYTGEILEKTAEPSEKDHEFLWIEYGRIRGKMFAEMQNWALEQVLRSVSRR